MRAGEAVVTERIDQFLAHVAPPTPCVVIDLDIVRVRYRALAALLPDARIHYAVKANPSAAVIAALAAEGASCDVASPGEIARCFAVGVPPERCCFGNTIKREPGIAAAFAKGIDLFAFDSPAELEKLARAAPGARVFCRIAEDTTGADWPLTRKFGCSPTLAAAMLLRARALGLRPLGVSFHVGSQQTRPGEWSRAVADAAQVFAHCARDGLELALVNLGGGLPAHYRMPVPPLADYIETIDDALTRHFGGARPELMIEPGRYMVADAGVLRAEVLLIARRGGADDRRWVYIDAGRYNGLAETQGECIHYRICTPRDGGATEAVVLAGPTCDSTDILYDRTDVELPLGLAIGDTIDFMSAGAYTASYASVEFNGFPPLATHCI
jgi:ornithine decarboxylase